MAEQILWKNRIVEYGVKPASQFLANPKNPRTHPQSQRDALRGSLDTLGWIAPVIENSRTGFLVDGHERIWQALAANDAEVPFIQVDLSPEEESQALLSLDFIAAMADTDRQNLAELLKSVDSEDEKVKAFLAVLRQQNESTINELIEEETEYHQAEESDQAIKTAEKVSETINALAKGKPEAFNRATMVIVPKQKTGEVMILIDDSLSDVIQELKRYEGHEEFSPLKNLMDSIVKF